MRRRTLALALVASAALVSGCGERAEPRGDLAPPYPATVAGEGEEPVVIESPPRRIVALDPGPAELVVALGARERLVGVPAEAAGVRSVPDATQVATAAGTVQVDAVVQLRPDLVVATAATDPVDLARTARATGSPLYVQPASSVADVERAVIELGFAIGKPVEARRVAGSMRRAIARVEEEVGAARPVRVFVDTGFLITVPERSLVGDLVRRAGGRSVAGANPGGEPFAPCRLARLDPDVVLTLTDAGGARVPPLPRFAKCPRKPGPLRRVLLPANLVTVAGPRVPRALEAVGRALHPDAFR